MAQSWSQMRRSGFERDSYSEELPVGKWSAQVEKTVYGKKPGIHVYMIHLTTSRRYWMFVPWAGGSDTYEFFKGLADRACIELNFEARAEGGKPKLISVRALG